jgi:UDP-galactopyranose mutase
MRDRHPRAYCFPSAVDLDHFRSARTTTSRPADQASIAPPRIGYAGVIDERIDLELVDGLAATRPDWQIVLLGPLAKIRPEDVPARSNIYKLGLKTYGELPDYLGGWDVGWMPFARNAATRFISPTKTPEYLAAGLPVVSTSIHDVVESYGRQGLVAIADSVTETIRVIDRALRGAGPDLDRVDRALATTSWDGTWRAMDAIVGGLGALQNVARSERRAAPPAARTTSQAGRNSRVGVGRGRAQSTSPAAAARRIHAGEGS